jgi:hypothetical protein
VCVFVCELAKKNRWLAIARRMDSEV